MNCVCPALRTSRWSRVHSASGLLEGDLQKNTQKLLILFVINQVYYSYERFLCIPIELNCRRITHLSVVSKMYLS